MCSFFFKQKTAYEMRISDWSSDVGSSDLREEGLLEDFVQMGVTIAKTMVEIFADLPPGHPFFEQFSFIGDDDLPEFRAIVARVDKAGTAALDPAARQLLLGLPFSYVEDRKSTRLNSSH